LIRRGLLKGLLAGAAITPAVGTKAAQNAALLESATIAKGISYAPEAFSDGGYSPGLWDKLWDLWNKGAGAKLDAQFDVARALGYMPPHLSSMHSTALWWRAQKTTEWYYKKTEEKKSLMDKLKAFVGIER